MSTGDERMYGNQYPNVRDPYFRSRNEYYSSNNPPLSPYYRSTTTEEPYYYSESRVDPVGNFSPFYIAITICTIIGFGLFLLNIFLGCCSRYSEYWNDRHTGNRWIVSLWTATPHKQPPLEYSTELQEIPSRNQVVYDHGQEDEQSVTTEFLELRSQRESEI